ncbi:acylneuraminate cytidylyltransferase family protein [Tistrella bauzanensis]|uniref:Acylneuraminate cytidylyltransferase family protein n=1 Tax=Tistrella arctica TaxID=3133430 RepID=A0ABU9YSX2_9PROT
MGSTVAIIPARGGSKGIPRKNVRMVAGKPLIAHSIEQALNSGLVDAVYVSTDDDEIAAVSERFGAKVVRRPDALASDTASSEAALIHAVDEIEARDGPVDLVVFLQCTSPIRAADDIDRAITTLRGDGADSLLSVVVSHRFLWKRGDTGATAINYDPANRPRRQDMTPQYVENGSIYLFPPEMLRTRNNRLGGRIALHEMAEETAYEIDSEVDMVVIETLLTQMR